MSCWSQQPVELLQSHIPRSNQWQGWKGFPNRHAHTHTHIHMQVQNVYIYSRSATPTNTDRKPHLHKHIQHQQPHPIPISGQTGLKLVREKKIGKKRRKKMYMHATWIPLATGLRHLVYPVALSGPSLLLVSGHKSPKLHITAAAGVQTHTQT